MPLNPRQPLPTDGRQAFIDAALEELRGTGEAFYARLTADQLPRVTQATADIAGLTLELLLAPHRKAQIEAELAFPKSTLTSEAALVALRAEAAVTAAIRRVLLRALAIAIAA